jgi:hypothetical protein
MTTDEGGVDQRWVFLADTAARDVKRQSERLDEHRSRAATLFSAAALASGFLGAEAFKAANGPRAWAWVGAGFFATTGCILAYVVWPRTWMFRMNAAAARSRMEAENLSIDQTYQAATAGWLEYYEQNEPRLRRLTVALAVQGMLVVGEIVAFFINLAVG